MDFEEIEVKFKHFDVICRFCLKKDNKLIDVIPQSIINFVSVDEEESITEMIELCTGIKISSFDKLPKNVCIHCFKELKDCNKFRQKCLKAQDKLENALQLHEAKLSKSKEDENNFKCEDDIEDYIDNIVKTELESEKEEDSPILIENNIERDDNTKKLETKTNKNKKSSKKIKSKIKKTKNIQNNIKPKIKSSNKINNETNEIHKKEKTKKKSTTLARMCQICGNLYKSLRGHLRKMHANRFKCNYCNITRPTLKGIEMHMNIHRENTCEFCGKSYQSKRRLREHRSAIHTKEPNYKCKQCEETFFLYDIYRKHLATHDPNSTKIVEYKCDICEKVFTIKDSFRKHCRIHTAEKCHKCEFCGKGFIRSQTLKDHRRVHTKERPYVCNHCGSTFTQKSSLNLHTKKFHPDEKIAMS